MYHINDTRSEIFFETSFWISIFRQNQIPFHHVYHVKNKIHTHTHTHAHTHTCTHTCTHTHIHMHTRTYTHTACSDVVRLNHVCKKKKFTYTHTACSDVVRLNHVRKCLPPKNNFLARGLVGYFYTQYACLNIFTHTHTRGRILASEASVLVSFCLPRTL